MPGKTTVRNAFHKLRLRTVEDECNDNARKFSNQPVVAHIRGVDFWRHYYGQMMRGFRQLYRVFSIWVILILSGEPTVILAGGYIS